MVVVDSSWFPNHETGNGEILGRIFSHIPQKGQHLKNILVTSMASTAKLVLGKEAPSASG